MDLYFVYMLQTSFHICHMSNSYGSLYNSYDMCEINSVTILLSDF